MTEIANSIIERNTSHIIIYIQQLDFTGWDLVYLAKNNINDDDDAITNINILPQIVNISDLDLSDDEKSQIADGIEKAIVVIFPPSATKNKKITYYEHSLRAISADKENVITLFNGKLQVTPDRIKAPL